MLSREKWWVSRSMVNRADARGGIWDVEVVEKIIGRPLHHTLLLVESQQACSSVACRLDFTRKLFDELQNGCDVGV